MQEIDCLALLLASICHDLEHPGTTNAFQVNTGSALALRYNDASVCVRACVHVCAHVKCLLLACVPCYVCTLHLRSHAR
jgi:hypothetical protein